jgi:hypothetical protein
MYIEGTLTRDKIFRTLRFVHFDDQKRKPDKVDEHYDRI